MNLVEKGSITARNGFKNEDDVIFKFNNWKTDVDAQKWLQIMNYDLERIESVTAIKLSGYKTDVQAQITIKLTFEIDAQNIQVKLVSNKKGFNQIDKRWIDSYSQLWNIPEDIEHILKLFTGQIAHNVKNSKDSRRLFMTEFQEEDQIKLLNFLNLNKILIVNDIIKGRGQFATEWVLVVQKSNNNSNWILKPVNIVINYFSQGDIQITKRGSIKIGKITMQRKGGDAGRKTANMLQFKLNPIELFDL